MEQLKILHYLHLKKINFFAAPAFFKFSKLMQKKIICFFICSVFFISASIFALGAGVQFGASPSFYNLRTSDSNQNNFSTEFSGNITGTIRFFRLPLVLGFGIETSTIQGDFLPGFSGFADFWFINLQIKNNWNFYSGAGISGVFLIHFSNEKHFFGSGGLRFFCGVETVLLDNFTELYVQLTGNPNICSLPQKSSQKNVAFCIKVPIEVGIRFHF